MERLPDRLLDNYHQAVMSGNCDDKRAVRILAIIQTELLLRILDRLPERTQTSNVISKDRFTELDHND